jgi:hypothetical protein
VVPLAWLGAMRLLCVCTYLSAGVLVHVMLHVCVGSQLVLGC